MGEHAIAFEGFALAAMYDSVDGGARNDMAALRLIFADDGSNHFQCVPPSIHVASPADRLS